MKHARRGPSVPIQAETGSVQDAGAASGQQGQVPAASRQAMRIHMQLHRKAELILGSAFYLSAFELWKPMTVPSEQ
jgi:hypothetical protein